MLLPWFVETRMLCWKAAIEEALMFTLDGIDIQFTSEWTGLDIVKKNYKLFFKQCTLPLRKMPNFHRISLRENFVKRPTFRGVSGELSETLWKMYLSTKFLQ